VVEEEEEEEEEEEGLSGLRPCFRICIVEHFSLFEWCLISTLTSFRLAA
jgi:hypothetical protein